MPRFSLFDRLFQRFTSDRGYPKGSSGHSPLQLVLPSIPDDIFLEIGHHLSRIELLEFSMLVRAVFL